MRKSRVKPLLAGRGKENKIQVDINNVFLSFRDLLSGVQYAFDYTGLKLWLKEFIHQTVQSKNVTLSCNSNAKVKIPAGSWVKGIHLSGSVTTLNLSFNGYTMQIDSVAGGYEIQPRKQYVETDTDLTVTSSNWGTLEIIVFI